MKIIIILDLINGGCNVCLNVKCMNYFVYVEDEIIVLEMLIVVDLVILLVFKEGFC